MNTTRLALSACILGTLSVAQSPLQTTFVGGLVISNNPVPAAVSQYFDLTISNPAGLVLTQIDMNYAANSAPTGQFDVWITAAGGTHNGNETSPAGWTLASAQTPNIASGQNAITLNSPIFLMPGTYGIALHSVGFNPIYTNPASQTPPLPATYSNADMTIDMSFARSRASDPTSPFGGTSNGFSPRHANIALHYTVGATSVDFTADVTEGPSPLTVQFTGIGFSGNPGGIIAWIWDFDNDGNPDSTLQNPTHTFGCGTFTVSLQIVDNLGFYTETKTDFIATDVLDPDFTVQAIATNQLQFTDTTTPTPTSWAWDFDNDGTVDSTAQNPVFTSTAAFCSELDVALTVQRNCQPAQTITRKTAVAKTLQTVFGGGTFTTSTATGGINFFDLQVLNPEGISLCALHTHTQGTAGVAVTYNLYLTDGTYQGNETSADPWTQVATETVNGAGGGNQTFVPLTTPVYLAPGTYGVALEHVGNSPRYTNLGGQMTYGNADMVLTAGATQAEPVFSTGTIFSPRIANIGLYYTDCTFTNQAGYGWFADGCPTSGGVVATNVATALPRIGQTFSVEVSPAPQGFCYFSIGFDRTNSAFGPLPVDLTSFGAPGCRILVRPDDAILMLGAPGSTLTLNAPIPNNPVLLCTPFYTQGYLLDPPANQLDAVSSDAAAGIIGQ